MKFKFAFETLLEYRRREEDFAMGEFLEAEGKHDEAKAVLAHYYDTIGQARVQISELQRQGGNQSESLRHLDLFIQGQEIRVGQQKLLVRTLNQVLEEKHEILVARAQARKALEKLKEKGAERFRAAMNKKALKEMDDLVTMRFRPESEER